MTEMAIDRLRIESCKSMSNYHVVDSYKIIHVVDLTGLARAYWRYWGQRHRTVVKTFAEHYPNVVSQTFVTGNNDCKFDFSTNVWQHLPRETGKQTIFIDPRHHLASRLPQISGVWPKEFSMDDTAPSVCTGDGPALDLADDEAFEIPDNRPPGRQLTIVSDTPSVFTDHRGILRRTSNDTTHAVLEEEGVCDPIVLTYM
jgi:hypothetical protein